MVSTRFTTKGSSIRLATTSSVLFSSSNVTESSGDRSFEADSAGLQSLNNPSNSEVFF
jgi:hypothetical protein